VNRGLTWPMVALAGLVLAFLVGIFALIPDDEPAGRTALLGAITAASAAVTTWVTTRRVGEVREQVEAVKRDVDGRMSQLIEAKTIQDKAARPPVVGQLVDDPKPIARHRKPGEVW
jgi:hypothetical protein